MKKRLILSLTLMTLLLAVLSVTVLAEFTEDIINFNWQQATVANVNGSWKVVVGNMWLLDFGGNQAQATQALAVIRHYRLNQQCFVGRPNAPMQYYLSNGRTPAGPMPGEDSIHFDNNNIRAVNVNGRWKIVEGGTHWMLDFGSNEAQAWAALRIIWKYDFSYICFVGRPNPPMMYFRR